MLIGPWNKKSPLYSSGACRFGLAVALLAFPVAPASAEDLLGAIFGRLGQPQLTTTPPSSYEDPWNGLRQAAPVDVRYQAPTSEMDPRFFRRVLDYPTLEKPGSIIIDTARALPLLRGGPGEGDTLRNRRRPRRLYLVRHKDRLAETRMARWTPRRKC